MIVSSGCTALQVAAASPAANSLRTTGNPFRGRQHLYLKRYLQGSRVTPHPPGGTSDSSSACSGGDGRVPLRPRATPTHPAHEISSLWSLLIGKGTLWAPPMSHGREAQGARRREGRFWPHWTLIHWQETRTAPLFPTQRALSSSHAPLSGPIAGDQPAGRCRA